MLGAIQHRSAARAGGRAAAGYTLVEVGLVLMLLGVMAIMVSEFYVSQLSLGKDTRRVAGTVRDMRTLIDASVLWSEAFGRWPNEGNVIGLEPLVAAGYLAEATRPSNRYDECGDCDDYTLLGWDRDVVGPDGKGDYTTVASDAEDLVVRLHVQGRPDAELIAGQLPLGHATELDTGAFAIEARVFEGGIRTGDFVRIQNENRPVVFGAENRSHNIQGGDLQRVGRITSGKQLPPCRPGQNPRFDSCQSATSPYVTAGPALLFHERPCKGDEDPDADGCRKECDRRRPKQETDECQVAPLSNQPMILFREGGNKRMCATDVGGSNRDCDPYFNVGTGPAVVLHGAESDTRADGPIIHMLPDTQSGYAKVRVVGGLEIERIAGRDGAPRPGQPPGTGTWKYSLPSSRDVVTQSELDWLQCCIGNLEVTLGVDPIDPDSAVGDVFCRPTKVATCVSDRADARLNPPSGP